MTRHLAVLAGLAFVACSAHDEPEPKPLVAVRVAKAERADLSLAVKAPALVHPRQQATIAPRITAAVRELLVRKGDRVAAGALLARLEKHDLLAQRQEAEAALHQAQVLAERRQRLFDEGAIPQRELLGAQTELATSSARLELVDAQLRFTELASPFAGTITEQFLYPGDMARPDNPVFTVMDLITVVARGQVPESEAGPIRSGQDCTFVGTDFPGRPVAGHVTVVNRAVDSARRTVEVWCEMPNPSGRLRPGGFGDLSIVTGTAPGSVVVPLSAVEFVEGTSKGSVLVVDAQKVAHRREVEGGEVLDGKVQITAGLQGGELIVIEGGYGLPDGTAVRYGDQAPR
jgi:RND family efflux transporter MFP subunit